MFQVAFGKIGLSPADFWDMTLREFMNAWIGWSENRNEQLGAHRGFIYGAARFNATATAFSKEQSRKISETRFPWEGQAEDNGLSLDQKIGSFMRREQRRIERNGKS